MAKITRLPPLRHLRSDPSMQTLRYRRGRLVRSGRGLAFWFRPMTTAVAEVPLDDRDVPFLLRGRTADFQDVTVQGTVTYRVEEPETLAQRIDFTIDPHAGRWTRTPLEQIAGLLTQLAQQFIWEYLAATPLQPILVEGVEVTRARIQAGLAAEPAVRALGLDVAAVRVAAIQPEAEVEQALQTPAREAIQQGADEATFERRALAVEKERAIQENELQNRIELAKRQQTLVTQEGQNERRRSEEAAAAQKIAAEAAAESGRLDAEVQAERVERVGGARVAQERERVAAYREADPAILLALAGQELASKLHTIEHLNITPEMLTPLLSQLVGSGGRRLDLPGE